LIRAEKQSLALAFAVILQWLENNRACPMCRHSSFIVKRDVFLVHLPGLLQ
jgi:hypothetical protein